LVYKKNKIVKDNSPESQVNDRIKQLQTEAEAVNCTYSLSEYDVAELVHEKYIEKFPDTYYVDITRMLRVKVGTAPQNYLVYFTEEHVTDNIRFKKHKFNRRRVGFHPIVTGEATYNEYGSLEGYDIGTPRTSFEIPFSPETVKSLISSARSGPKELLLGRGATMGEHPLAEPPITCFNLDNFLFGDFDLLMEAGRLHYLNSGSGFDEFLKVRTANLEHAVPIIKKDNGPKEK
jgi:hypothetical protein